MNTILGANWRTTLIGWIAVLASAIAINPSLVSFLPETIRNYVTGFAGILAVVSGGTFAAQAKDKNVTGGSVPNDAGQSNNNITPLILLALLPVFALSGCAWVQAHKTQIDSTLAVVGNRALNVAEQVLISVAADEADKNFKADFLDAVASGLRQNEATIVNSADVAKIVQIWSPNDGAQWQQLAASLGTVAGNALATAGKTEASTIVENIATGLNTAAAQARTATAAQ
ncbi:MAG: hypothetical protein ACFUZC_07525 [Chthoniobacteraceae bacterium]